MQFVYFCSAIHVIELHFFFSLLLYFDNNLYVQYVHSFEKRKQIVYTPIRIRKLCLTDFSLFSQLPSATLLLFVKHYVLARRSVLLHVAVPLIPLF